MKKIIVLKVVAVCLVAIFAFQTKAQTIQTFSFTPVGTCKEDVNGNTIENLNNVKMFFRDRRGENPLILFDIETNSRKTVRSVIFDPKVSTYHYEIKQTSSGKICRVIYLFTDHDWVNLALWIPQDFSGYGSVFFNYSYYGKHIDSYEVVLSADDSKKLFRLVNRAIKELKFKKLDSTTLPPDTNL